MVSRPKFASAAEARQYLIDDKGWIFHYKNCKSEGEKYYYRCKKAKQVGPQCATGRSLLFCSESRDVISFNTDSEHTTASSNPSKITVEIKDEIKKLYEPKAILRQINQNNSVLIKMAQLRNALQQIKKKSCSNNLKCW